MTAPWGPFPLPPTADLAGALPGLRCPRLPTASVTAAKKSATDLKPYLAGKAANSSISPASSEMMCRRVNFPGAATRASRRC
jgi:hypothetical protein